MLFDAQARLLRQILFHGNGPLEPDPYRTPRRAGENATMTAESLRDPHTEKLNKMTFDTLLETARGLFDFLYKDGRRGSVITHVFDARISLDVRCGTVAVRPFGN